MGCTQRQAIDSRHILWLGKSLVERYSAGQQQGPTLLLFFFDASGPRPLCSSSKCFPVLKGPGTSTLALPGSVRRRAMQQISERTMGCTTEICIFPSENVRNISDSLHSCKVDKTSWLFSPHLSWPLPARLGQLFCTIHQSPRLAKGNEDGGQADLI